MAVSGPYNFTTAQENLTRLTLHHRAMKEASFPAQCEAVRRHARFLAHTWLRRRAVDENEDWEDSPEYHAVLEGTGAFPPWPGVDEPDLVPEWARTPKDWAEHMETLQWKTAEIEIERAGFKPYRYTPLDLRGKPAAWDDEFPLPITAERPHGVWHPAPGPQPYGVSDEGAEAFIADWMKYIGAKSATVTSYIGDGGIDVVSSLVIAQVKNYAPSRSVGVAEIRELAGVAAVDRRLAAFFTSGKYAAGATAFASAAGIALFRYSVKYGAVLGENELGINLSETGILED